MTSKTKISGLATLSTTATIRNRIEAGGERVWRFADFAGLPSTAVAQSLSRLARQGMVQRLGKGIYYRSRQTAFGMSKPNPAQLRMLPLSQKRIFPAGIGAANLLGFTTQNPGRIEIATEGTSLPRLLVGLDTVIHTRRPESWRNLTELDTAFLDFLRHRGESSELSPDETVEKVLAFVREPGRFDRLLKAAPSEPPRVRAILGAIAEQLGVPASQLFLLRTGLNPLSRFDFGILSALKHAKDWQAKERRKP